MPQIRQVAPPRLTKTASKPRETTAAARRVPTQARSIKRFEQIVDAAASLFASSGFEAATMEGIAERASTSIGSVYQFFPHKEAVFDAVAERSLTRSRAVFDALFAERDASGGELPWRTLVTRTIDTFAQLHTTEASFRAVFVNVQLYGRYKERDEELNRYFVGRVIEMLTRVAPRLDPARRTHVAITLVWIASSLLLASERVDPWVAVSMREEAKTLLVRYLEPETGGEPSPEPRPKSRKGKPG
jgi:AcrR family transcriptional regulator